MPLKNSPKAAKEIKSPWKEKKDYSVAFIPFKVQSDQSSSMPVVESPARVEGAGAKWLSLESLHCRKWHRPAHSQNPWSLILLFPRECGLSGNSL